MRLIVDAPVPRPRKYGLYSAVPPTQGDHLRGIEFEKNDNCTITLTAFTGAWCATGTAKAKSEGYAGTSTFDPFALYTLEECGVPSANVLAKAQADAVRKYNYGEERAVEARLATMLSAEPGIDKSATTPEDLVQTLALLEEWLDDTYAGSGIIFASRESGSILLARQAVRIAGTHLETNLGNLFVPSGAFGGGPSAAGAGNTWLFATGTVQIERGEMFTSGPVQLLSNSTTEVQTLGITGGPTGGNYTLSFAGETTGNIAYNATNTTIQNALIALNAFNSGDVTVAGASPNFTITFGGQYVGSSVPQITATPALTGGTAPSITMATTTSGGSGLGDNSWQVLVERPMQLSYDCAVAAAKSVSA